MKRKDKLLDTQYAMTFNELVRSFVMRLKSNLTNFLACAYIAMPVIVKNANMDDLHAYIISVLFFFVFMYHLTYKNNKENRLKDGMPMPEHRFTRLENDMIVRVNNDEMQEAIIYLYNVEEYLILKGFLK